MPAPLPAAAAAAASNARAVRAVDDTYYPSSDGRPMAENMWQSRVILNAVGDIEEAHPQALVAADILVYPEQGNRDNSVAPDVLVAFGLGTESRPHYRVWVEGKPPDWVLEVTSPSTKSADLGTKWRKYAAMGVREYWLFDPRSRQRRVRRSSSHEESAADPRRTPPLQGLKLVDGEYRPLASRLVDGERMIRSEVLGLDVRVDAELLRFRDAATGRDVQHRPEIKAAAKRSQAVAERAEAQARQEAAQRKTAEARAKREAVRAERAEARASREAAARATAEARVAELEAALRRRG